MTMMEKNFASLTAGLLARKGQARPAIRPALSAVDYEPQADRPLDTLLAQRAPAAPVAPDRIDVAQVREEATPQPVADADMADTPAEISATPSERTPRPASPQDERASAASGRSAFTLRLDADRHLKLRLACAHRNISAQQMVTAALDAWLAEHAPALPERACPCREIGAPDQRSLA